MAFGVKTNERPGTRAQVRYARMSAYKAREVLDLIRGKDVDEAADRLQFVERDAAIVIRKCLASAVANASHNDELDPNELFVSACYADEGPTLKRWRPRARGRATRIRKRTCHITIVVSRLPEDALARRRARDAAALAASGGRRGRRGAAAAAEARRARVAKSRGETAAAAATEAELDEDAAVPGEPSVETLDQIDELAGDQTETEGAVVEPELEETADDVGGEEE
jgi:large subunit ribosomal protein L22